MVYSPWSLVLTVLLLLGLYSSQVQILKINLAQTEERNVLTGFIRFIILVAVRAVDSVVVWAVNSVGF